MNDVVQRLSTALADRYRLERELGRGGMAAVYLAEDVKHQRRVAIKVLHPELSAVLGAERFLTEIRTTANLQHPHILGLIDSGECSGLLYYVMPFVDGETLRTKLERERQLPVKEAVRVATEVANALDYAHKRGVIHRDIKPENILLQDGQALVADFGIALAVSQAGGARMTQTGLSLGTPSYMSPEQAMGEKTITAKSDVYALGAMTYEMLMGDPPFGGSTAQAIVSQILTALPRPIRAFRPNVPESAERAVLAALEKLPADRPESAKAFAAALAGEASLEGRSQEATRVLPAAARPRDQRLARVLVSIAALALAAVSGAVLGGRLRPAPPQATLRTPMALPRVQRMEINRAGVNLALSPDGSRLVYASPGGDGPRLWLRHRNRLEAVGLGGGASAAGTAINPVFAPDGRRIAFSTGADMDLGIVDVDGGGLTMLAQGGAGSSGGIAWADDGWIYFDSREGITRVRETGGPPELAVPFDTASGEIGHAWPDVLPGGRMLLFRSRRNTSVEDFQIVAFDLERRTRHSLGKGLMARYLAPGLLAIVRADGVLTVARIDERDATLSGAPVPVLDGIRTKLLGSLDVAVSRTGTLAYVRGVSSIPAVQAVWVTREGGVTPIEPALTFMPVGNRGLALSPDGRRLAVDVLGPRSLDIWVRELPSGPFTRVTFDGLESTRPSWSPDGRDVVYIHNAGQGVNAVWRKRADGSTPAESVFATSASIQEALISGDGRWLIYRVPKGNQGDVYAVRLDQPGSTPVALLESPFSELTFSLSPDGRWLAYVSAESGRSEVYVRPFPETNSGRWQLSSDGGLTPRWSRSGRELFFATLSGELMSVAVTGQPTFSAGAPKRLFGGIGTQFLGAAMPYYDIGPDDRRILMMRIAGRDEDTEQLIMVDNWLDEVRAKLAEAERR
jgi:Tol biopolymer transport system component/tRNA A-37 threonylcarbamoyl transferase component Bud32